MLELLPLVFLSGVITFLAPCTLPLLPAYLAFLGGVSVRDLSTTVSEKSQLKKTIVKNALFFVLGFAGVFWVVSLLISGVGFFFAPLKEILQKLSGLILIFFGLELLQISRLLPKTVLTFGSKLNKLKPGSVSGSFIFGASMALGWSPCVGPILGSVLTLVGGTGTFLTGAMLLFVFTLGLGLPFLLLSMVAGRASVLVRKIGPYLSAIEKIGGFMLFIIGLVLIFNAWDFWIAWFYQIFSFMKYEAFISRWL